MLKRTQAPLQLRAFERRNQNKKQASLLPIKPTIEGASPLNARLKQRLTCIFIQF